MVRKPLT